MDSMTIDELLRLYNEHERQQAALMPEGYDAVGEVMTEDPYWMDTTRPSALNAELARRRIIPTDDAVGMPPGWTAAGREVNEYDPSWSQLRPGMDTPNLATAAPVMGMPNTYDIYPDRMQPPPKRRRT